MITFPPTYMLAPLAAGLVFATTAMAQTEAETARFEQLVAAFQGATIIGTPSIVDCTLSEGAAARCLKITTVGAPSDHITGPYCPRNISDTAVDGGKWFVDGEVVDVDGDFIARLAEIYDDDAWHMFDENTGEINVRGNEIGCIVAGDPTNETNQPDNICVDCGIGFIGGTVTQTYTIPLAPIAVEKIDTNFRPAAGVGVAWNGAKFDAPAPLDLILGGHTLGPMDDCGGHINPFTGYHYHGIMDDCGARVAAADVDHAPIVGVAMDGYDIHERLDLAGTEPDDLDACRGHDDGFGYHYHVNPAAENQIIGCFTAQTGCSATDPDAACDASVSDRPRGPRPE